MRIYEFISIISLIFILLAGIYFFLNLGKPVLISEWKIEGITKGAIKDFEIDREGRIYLVLGNRIKVYSSNGEFLQDIGKEGNLMSYAMEGLHSYRKVGGEIEGEFISLTDIAIDDSGNVYASDSLLKIIQKFDGNGRFLKKWGGYGKGRKYFERLVGIAGIDFQGSVYAYDSEKIVKFDSKGEYLSTIEIGKLKHGGNLIRVDFSGELILFSISENKVYIYEERNLLESISLTKEKGEAIEYLDMDIDGEGKIYLLKRESIIIIFKELKGRREIKLKRGKIPILLRVDREGKFMYLVSYISSPFFEEERAEVYIQKYKIER